MSDRYLTVTVKIADLPEVRALIADLERQIRDVLWAEGQCRAELDRLQQTITEQDAP